MENYSLADLEVSLASCVLKPSQQAYYEKALKQLQQLEKTPILSLEKLQVLAQKIRPIYRFNRKFVYWLTPAGGAFVGHFGSAPLPSETNKQDFLGVSLENLKPVCRFRCYSLDAWQPMFFDLAELFRQIPEDIDINSWQAGAIELCIKVNEGSVFDHFLQLYSTPVVLYKMTEDIPNIVQAKNPLPPDVEWLPLI